MLLIAKINKNKKIYLCICVKASYKRLIVMTAPLLFGVIWNISEMFRLEKTCLDVNTAQGE